MESYSKKEITANTWERATEEIGWDNLYLMRGNVFRLFLVDSQC